MTHTVLYLLYKLYGAPPVPRTRRVTTAVKQQTRLRLAPVMLPAAWRTVAAMAAAMLFAVVLLGGQRSRTGSFLAIFRRTFTDSQPPVCILAIF